MEEIVQFPRWVEVVADSSLGPKEREGYKVTIRWFFVTAKAQVTGGSA